MRRPHAVPRPEAGSALAWRTAILVGSLLIGLMALGCQQIDELTAPARATAMDYAVYDAVLDSLYDEHLADGAAPLLVIDDSTSAAGEQLSDPDTPYTFGPRLDPSVAALIATTRDDFAARGAERAPLDAQAFHARGRVALHSASAIVSENPSDYWDRFHARYPGADGEIRLSRPGYDASHTHALLAVGRGCGGLCGAWGYALLERRGGRWVVLGYEVTVVS